ncbi:hypothetical protein KM043_011105 [Ampulex compressa]|nr:hypothetical protein KM043_011105 [Ampulex compressa]
MARLGTCRISRLDALVFPDTGTRENTEDFKRLRGKPFVTQVQTLWRKAWDEIPEIMASTGLAALGTLMFVYASCTRTGYGDQKYFTEYTVYRPDDPRVKKIEHTSRYD